MLKYVSKKTLALVAASTVTTEGDVPDDASVDVKSSSASWIGQDTSFSFLTELLRACFELPEGSSDVGGVDRVPNGDPLSPGDVEGPELLLALSPCLLRPCEGAENCTAWILGGERRCERRMTVGLPNVVESLVETRLVSAAGVDWLRFITAAGLLWSPRVSDLRDFEVASDPCEASSLKWLWVIQVG